MTAKYMKRDPGSLNGDPAKAGQFLSYKHSVPLCRADIMLTFKTIPGEIVPGRNILMYTWDEKRLVPANVPSRLPYKQPLRPG